MNPPSVQPKGAGASSSFEGTGDSKLKGDMHCCVNWQGFPSGDQPSARIGMCKWPTFYNQQMLLANTDSSSRSVIGRERAPTICPDHMSFGSYSDDLRFFESQVLRLEIRMVASPVFLPVESRPPSRIVARILFHRY